MAEVSGNSRDLLEQRWSILSHAAVTMMSAGGLYLFSAYSSQLAETMNYNNTELGVIGTANNLGTWFGVTGGLFCARFGLHRTAVAAAALSVAGMLCLALASLSILPRSYLFAALSTFAFSQGQGWAYLAAMKATLQNFNAVDRGSVVGSLVCFFALSSGFWATTYKAVFVHMNLALFFVCLGAGCGAMQLYAGMMTSRFSVAYEAPLLPWERLHVTYVMYYAGGMSLYILAMSLTEHLVSPTVYVVAWLFLLGAVVALPFMPSLLRLVSSSSQGELVMAVAPRTAATGTGREDSAIQMETMRDQPECVATDQGTDESSEGYCSAAPQESRPLEPMGHDNAPNASENDEISLMDLARSPLFWLLMASVALGLSFPITLINNCATLVRSLLSTTSNSPPTASAGVVSVLVALFAVFNCWGRMLTGYASSRFLLSRPRWQWFLAALLAQLTGNLVLLVFWSLGVLYVSVPLAGLGIGGIFAVAPVATSDIFLTKNFPMAWGALTIAPCISTELISGLLAGSVADKASETSSTIVDGRRYCIGDDCFYLTFVVTFFLELCAIGCALALLWQLDRNRRAHSALVRE